MPSLTLTSYVSSASGLAGAMITDLEIIDPGGEAGSTLYITTGYSGYISAWDLTSTGPRQLNSSRHTRNDVPGTTACLGFINTPGGPAVLTGGGSKGALVLRDLNNDGGLGTQTNIGTLPTLPGDLIATVTVTLTNGTQVVYGGLAGASGVGQLNFNATGSLTGSAVTADTTFTSADRVVALAEIKIGGQQYLFTASSSDVGVTCWAVSSTGTLTAVTTMTTSAGLWIGTPTALDTAVVAGQTYLVVAAAGSNTLSLIAVGPDGSMRLTDNIGDDLQSRVAGATAMAVVEHAGQTYVIAGGGDDGISLYQILPGGQFLALAHLADTAAMGLSDVSAIAAQSTSTGIQIFVGSSSETGVTQLNYDPGAAGQTLLGGATGGALTGGANNDVLVGGAGSISLSGGGGNDTIIGGDSYDMLTGGSGADIFVVSGGGTSDLISDFTLGTDKIDLSGWSMLRGLSQLTMVSTPTGMTIAYGAEVLVVNSSTGGPINPASLTEADLLNLTRIPAEIPFIVAPPRQVAGAYGNDLLTGETGNDTLSGFLGSDALFGGDGIDWLQGSYGDDLLDGGTGADVLNGGVGHDSYYIDDVGDFVQREVRYSVGGGVDAIYSSISLALPPNTEFLIFQGSAHLNGTGREAGQDALIGNSGDNQLDGLGQNDGINGGAGNDTLIGGEGRDWLCGGDGADTFVYRSSTESRIGWTERDMVDGFEHGLDTIHLYDIDANTLVSGDQAFRFIGTDSFTGQGSASAGELRAYSWNGGDFILIEADVNGDGAADMQILVQGTNTLSAADFIL